MPKTKNTETKTGEKPTQKIELRTLDHDNGFELEVISETFADSGAKEICVLTIWMKSKQWLELAEQISATVRYQNFQQD